MTDERLYCDEPECDREVAGHGRDKCSTHLKQLQRTGKTTPIAEKVSPKEHMINLLDRWANADGDEEHDAAERAVVQHVKVWGRKSLKPEDVAEFVKQALSEAARRRLAAARARGVRLGRPTIEVDPAEVFRLLAHFQSPADVAVVLKVSRATLYRILKRSGFETPRASGPRNQRGST